MGQHTDTNVDARIQAFKARRSQKTFADTAADWFHARFGDRKESLQSTEVVTWAHYER